MEIVHNQHHLHIVVSNICCYRSIPGSSGIYERGEANEGDREAIEMDVYIMKGSPHWLFDRIEASLSQERGLAVVSTPKGKYNQWGYFTIWMHKQTDLYQLLHEHHIV